MIAEEDYLLLSGIQHFSFCPRQWGLIYIEQQWAHNHLTIGGDIMHNKAHDGDAVEKRGDTIIFRALKIASRTLGISGECDVVEFHKDARGVALHGFAGLWLPYPVEYKRGRPKTQDCDRLQLCAQALCLEEMLCTKIESGALFYGESRRRETVEFSPQLREKLAVTVETMHSLYAKKYTPKAKPGKHCQSCSMNDLCLPWLSIAGKTNVQKYYEENLV